jgi:hypothetical protein
VGELSEGKTNNAFSSYSVPGAFKLANLEAKPMSATAAPQPATAADMMYLVQWLTDSVVPVRTINRNTRTPPSWQLLPAGATPTRRVVTSGGANLVQSIANGIASLRMSGKTAGLRLLTGGGLQPGFTRPGTSGGFPKKTMSPSFFVPVHYPLKHTMRNIIRKALDFLIGHLSCPCQFQPAIFFLSFPKFQSRFIQQVLCCYSLV